MLKKQKANNNKKPYKVNYYQQSFTFAPFKKKKKKLASWIQLFGRILAYELTADFLPNHMVFHSFLFSLQLLTAVHFLLKPPFKTSHHCQALP